MVRSNDANISFNLESFAPNEESSSTTSTDSWFLIKPSKNDIFPTVLGIIILLMGLTAALLSFFLLQGQEIVQAQNSLDQTSVYAIMAYGRALTSVVNGIQTYAAFFNLSSTTPNFTTQSTPLLYCTGSFPQYINTVGWALFFNNTGRALMEAQVRETLGVTLGGEWMNFTFTARNALNQPIVDPVYPLYLAYVQSLPLYANLAVLGYDLMSNPAKNETARRMLETKAMVASPKVLLGNLRTSDIAMGIYVPLFNQTNMEITGAFTAGIVLSQFTSEALIGIISDDIYVVVYDLNSTTVESLDYGFVYSTQTYPGSNVTVDAGTTNTTLQNAPFVSSGVVQFADRLLQVTFVPTPAYIANFVNPTKWIALVVSFILTIILLIGCVFLFFSRKLFAAQLERKASKEQISLLRNSQKSLRRLLTRISDQEQKTRATINAIPDYIIVINNTGKIVQTNRSFDDDFGYGFADHEKGLTTGWIFPSIKSDFYKNAQANDLLTTIARTRSEKDIKVQLRVISLLDENMNLPKDTSPNTPLSLQSDTEVPFSNAYGDKQDDPKNIDEEAYLIIAHPTDKIDHDLKKNLHRNYEFENCLRDAKKRKQLLEFCKLENKEKYLLFIEEVRTYQQLSFEERIQKQNHIISSYIEKGGENHLDLPSEIIREIAQNTKEGFIDVNLFCMAKEYITKIFVEDVFLRFQSQYGLNQSN